jgi:hypothetical protein
VDAPDPNVRLSFEAASVKPSDPKARSWSGIRRQPGGRFNTFNTPVRLLITFAYQIQGYQLVGGPDWISNTRYDIVAKMEGDPPPVRPGTGADHMMLATRTLLDERFKLKVHREDARARYLRPDDGEARWKAGSRTQDGLGRLLARGVYRASRGAATGAWHRTRVRYSGAAGSYPVRRLPADALRSDHLQPGRPRGCRSHRLVWKTGTSR